ncbi:MAG: PilN domain-containing protein [Acidobacteria bacterium]|nr:PilN domain-containing protein [Acidobacteriota bacterium]
MIKINLFPTFETTEGTPVQQYAVLLFVLGVVAMGGWYLNATSGRADMQEQVSLLETETARLKELTAQVVAFEQQKQSLEERIAIIERLQANQKGPVELMNIVIGAIPDNPPGLWLTSLVQQEATISIQGRAFDVPFVADFIAALDDTRIFNYVDLEFWEQDQENSIRFQLSCGTEGETQ